jgi:hypothetical protein
LGNKNLVIENFQLLLGTFLSLNWAIESFQLLTGKKIQSSLGNILVIIWKSFVIQSTMAQSPPLIE